MRWPRTVSVKEFEMDPVSPKAVILVMMTITMEPAGFVNQGRPPQVSTAIVPLPQCVSVKKRPPRHIDYFTSVKCEPLDGSPDPTVRPKPPLCSNLPAGYQGECRFY